MKYKKVTKYKLTFDGKVPSVAEVLGIYSYCTHMWEDDISVLDSYSVYANTTFDKSTSAVSEDVMAYTVRRGDSADDEATIGRITLHLTNEDENDYSDDADLTLSVMVQDCIVTKENNVVSYDYKVARDWKLSYEDMVYLGLVSEDGAEDDYED